MSDTDACRGFRLTSAHWDRMALFSGAPAYPAFAVASPPAGGTFDEAIFTMRGGLSVGGSANPASDQIDASSNDQQTASSLTDQ